MVSAPPHSPKCGVATQENPAPDDWRGVLRLPPAWTPLQFLRESQRPDRFGVGIQVKARRVPAVQVQVLGLGLAGARGEVDAPVPARRRQAFQFGQDPAGKAAPPDIC